MGEATFRKILEGFGKFWNILKETNLGRSWKKQEEKVTFLREKKDFERFWRILKSLGRSWKSKPLKYLGRSKKRRRQPSFTKMITSKAETTTKIHRLVMLDDPVLPAGPAAAAPGSSPEAKQRDPSTISSAWLASQAS